MTAFASLNGERIVKAKMSTPARGIWAADIETATEASITTAVELTIANLTLKGSIVRGGPYAGARTARIVGGANGWPKLLAPQAYYKAGGVQKSMVARDAAAAVGEQVAIAQDTTMRDHWIREGNRKAENVLYTLFGDAWWIDEKGVTQCQDRTNTAKITTPYTIVSRSAGKGTVEIATEDVASWMPGRTFQNDISPELLSINLVALSMEGEGKLRLEILTERAGV